MDNELKRAIEALANAPLRMGYSEDELNIINEARYLHNRIISEDGETPVTSVRYEHGRYIYQGDINDCRQALRNAGLEIGGLPGFTGWGVQGGVTGRIHDYIGMINFLPGIGDFEACWWKTSE